MGARFSGLTTLQLHNFYQGVDPFRSIFLLKVDRLNTTRILWNTAMWVIEVIKGAIAKSLSITAEGKEIPYFD